MAGVGVNLATQFVDIVPSMRGIEGKLTKSLNSPVGKAGSKAGQSLGSRMASAAGKVVKTGIVVGAASAGAVAGATLLGGFKNAVSRQNSQKVFTGLYGSAKGATAIMKDLRNVASKSPIDYESYLKAGESLAYAGVKGKDATGTLKNVGKAIVAAGGDSTKLDQAMGGVMKAVNNGGIAMMDSLSMISESGVPILSGLAEKFGQPIDVIKKMASKGEISINDVMDVMQKGTGETFQTMIKAGDAASLSFGNQWKIAKDNVINAVGTKMIPLLDKLAPVIGTVGNKIASWIDNVDLSPMVGWFQGIGKWVGQLDFSSWNGFTKSLGGGGASTALSSIFDSVKKLAPVFGELFVSVQKSAPAMATLARGGVDILAGALQFLADHMDTIVKWMPLIIGGIIAWQAATALQNKVLAFQAPILAASNVLRLTAAIVEGQNARAKIANTSATVAQTSAENVGLATKVRTVAATIAQRTATVATSIATRAAAAGQWLLNAAMTANPIGLIIAGIAALVAGLVWFFTQTKIGQTIITAVWSGIKTAIGAVVTWFTGSVVPFFQTAIGHIVAGFQMFKLAATIAWNGFKLVLSTVWTWVKTYVFQPIANFVTVTIPNAFKVLKTLVGLYILGWRIVINAAWSFVRDKIFTPLKTLVTVIIPTAFSTFKKLVEIRMNMFRLAVLNKYLWVRQNVFDPLKHFVTVTIPNAFTTFKNLIKSRMENFRTGIHTAYTWVKDHTFGPLQNLIKNTVPKAFNTGVKAIGDFWGKLKKFAAKPVNFVIDTVYNNGIRKLWNPIAGLIGKDKWKLDKIDAVKGFRTGGKVWGAGTETSDSIPARLSRNEHVLTAKDVRNLGGHASVYKLRADAARGLAPGFAKGGMVWNNLWGIVKNQFPWARLTSAYRGGSRTASGNTSYHASGRAVDLAGRGSMNMGDMMKIFNFIAANYGQSSELIHTPAGGRQIKNGRHYKYTGAVARMHNNHVHWANKTAFGGPTAGASGSAGGGGSATSIWDALPGLKKLRDLKSKLSNMESGRFGEVIGGLAKKGIAGLVDKAKEAGSFLTDAVSNVKDVITTGAGRARGRAWATAQGWPLIGSKRWKALDYIVSHESGWREKAKNPNSSASGLGQMINSTSQQYLGGSPMSRFPFDKQLKAIVNYTGDRYGGLVKAEQFWKRNRYYAKGGAVEPLFESELDYMSGKMPKPHVFDGGGWLTDRMVAVHGKRQPDAVLSSQQWNDVHRLAVEGEGNGQTVNLTVNINGDIESRATAEKVVDDLSFEVKRIFNGGRYVGK